jgi:rubredoxin
MTSSWEYDYAVGENPTCSIHSNERLLFNMFYEYYYCPICKKKYI